MAHNRGGLLAQIEAGVADHTVALSSLLQTCIVIGGQAGSEKMRDWACQELHGYAGADTVPDYRHVPAAVMAVITNRAGYNPITQRIEKSVFPSQIRDIIREKVDLEDAILGGGIGELEALASQATDVLRLIPSWSGFIADTLNQFNMAPNSRVTEVYWSMSKASVLGVLSRVRTALAELVAELITLTPQGQEVPDKQAADQVVQFVITGDRSVINYSPQHATRRHGCGARVRPPRPPWPAGTRPGPVAERTCQPLAHPELPRRRPARTEPGPRVRQAARVRCRDPVAPHDRTSPGTVRPSTVNPGCLTGATGRRTRPPGTCTPPLDPEGARR
jgi:hypothetical protein